LLLVLSVGAFFGRLLAGFRVGRREERVKVERPQAQPRMYDLDPGGASAMLAAAGRRASL